MRLKQADRICRSHTLTRNSEVHFRRNGGILKHVQRDLAGLKSDMRAGRTGLRSHTRTLDVLQQHFGMVRATVSHIADANVTSDVVEAPHAM